MCHYYPEQHLHLPLSVHFHVLCSILFHLRVLKPQLPEVNPSAVSTSSVWNPLYDRLGGMLCTHTWYFYQLILILCAIHYPACSNRPWAVYGRASCAECWKARYFIYILPAVVECLLQINTVMTCWYSATLRSAPATNKSFVCHTLIVLTMSMRPHFGKVLKFP